MATDKDAHLWERSDKEWYVEPQNCTAALLRVERFEGLVWDPACGAGNVVKAIRAHGLQAVGTDVVDRRALTAPDASPWFGDFALEDFLAMSPARFGPTQIIMNPPFGKGLLTEAFIRHALAGPRVTKVAVFTDIKFLASTKRAKGLWADHPPDRVYMIAPRPSCPPGAYLHAGNKAGGGTADFIWLVWEPKAPFAGTTLSWLIRGE